jgi:hypothetical protein
MIKRWNRAEVGKEIMEMVCELEAWKHGWKRQSK